VSRYICVSEEYYGSEGVVLFWPCASLWRGGIGLLLCDFEQWHAIRDDCIGKVQCFKFQGENPRSGLRVCLVEILQPDSLPES
jgi:hypothetical protein